MKKIIYTAALLLTALAAKAQEPIKQTSEEIANITLLKDGALLYAKREAQGQYLFREGKEGVAERDPQLNAGFINTVVGTSAAGDEVYVYQQSSRRDKQISVYRYEDGGFTKTGELQIPRLRNHSRNLGLYLTPDKRRLYISGELSKSEGHDDLYLSEREGEKWSRPKGLGKGVNSREVEFAPFVTADSLYFSRTEGSQAYVYAVALEAGVPAGEPVKLDQRVNKEGAFNAYYTKQDGKELWTSALAEDYTTYFVDEVELRESPEENGKSTGKQMAAATAAVNQSADKQDQVPAKVPATTAKSAETAGLQLDYSFNKVFMDSKAERKLRVFLGTLASGTTLVVKGFSDAVGPEAGKENVSRKRASLVQSYIQRNYSQKGFRISTENQVLPERGQEGRRVELSIQ